MAATLYNFPVKGTEYNLFTYTGNISGQMSTYNNQLSVIFSGSVGAAPNDIYNEYNPITPGFTDLDGGNFKLGRTYLVAAKSNFNLGVSGTDYKAVTNKRYLHSRAPGVALATGSNINTIGFDINNQVTPLSTAFNRTSQEFVDINSKNLIIVNRHNDTDGRNTVQTWSNTLQIYFDGLTPAQKQSVIDDGKYFFFIHPLSSYLIYSNLATTEGGSTALATTISAVRTKSFLMSDAKDYYNDNVFLTTDSGQYITL